MKILRLIGYNLALCLLLLPGYAQAQGVQDFTIVNFEAGYQLTNKDPQGYLRVTERLSVDFSGHNHGILRTLPSVYGAEPTLPHVFSVRRDGMSEPFITYEENSNMVVRIGDAKKTITGEHIYEITYTMQNVIRFYDTHDEFYWDINGTEWLQPFEAVSVNVEGGFKIVEPLPVCFTGRYGSTSKACRVSDLSGSFKAKTTRKLQPGETLTIVSAFEKGYFTPPTWAEKNRFLLYAAPILLAQYLIFLSAYRKWKKFGKDYKKRGITVPYFERPKNITLLQAGYVLENKLTARHLSATIIDLGVRGYVKIIEEKKMLSVKHDLELTKSLSDKNLADDERKLLNDLFSNGSIGTRIRLEDKKNKLHSTLAQLQSMLDEKTLQKGFYELSPKKTARLFAKHYVLGFIALGAGIVFVGATRGISVIGGIVTFVSILILGALMAKRSPAGNYLVEHMNGLKLYLNTAERERMEKQDAVAAPLAVSKGEPVRDVKFFEKLLPFAVAMGVEKSWAKAFENIYQTPPDWYQGNWRTFNTVALVNSIGKTTDAAMTSFSAPSSSGSSGFSSGGGFSGGGGGGGGGGGW